MTHIITGIMSVTEESIGIDLGTTYSCVGVFKNGKVEILANDQGERTTPSYVAFTDEERLVGTLAKKYSSMNPSNVLFDVKRFIGRKFSDPVLQKDLKYFPYEVENDGQDRPRMVVTVNGKVEKYYPEQISALVLSYMKKTAENYLGCDVKNAVITVPAYFNDGQRQATKDAGKIAGLNVLRVINEPTSASIAYGLDKDDDKEHNILIFDLGGGTFDVSVLTVCDGNFEVLATSGDTHLGGEDFDNRLVDYCVKEFNNKNKVDVTTNEKSMRRLRTECENAKRQLSTTLKTSLQVPALFNGVDFELDLTRSKLEDLCNDLFRKCLGPVETALQVAKLDKGSINDIVLVGGSTRIPKVKELLSSFFGGKKLCESINPDEAVAYGATVYAAKLSGNKDEVCTNIVLHDVTPLSLGVEVGGYKTEKLIPRATKIPYKKVETFTTGSHNQTTCRIKVLEGERPLSKDNNVLSTFDLVDITPKPKGAAQIEVTYDLDANGILTVSATEKLDGKTGKTKEITVNNNKGRLSKDQIDDMIAQAEQFKDEDEAMVAKLEAKQTLESYLSSWKAHMDNEETVAKFQSDDVEKIKNTLSETESWLDGNLDASKEEYVSKLDELKTVLEPYQKTAPMNESEGSMPQMPAGFNPEQFQEMMKNMTPEQLEELKKNAGLPENMSTEDMMGAMKGMSSEPSVEEPEDESGPPHTEMGDDLA